MKLENVHISTKTSFKMKSKIIRLNPEKTKEWFFADRDFLNSTYQDRLIYSAIDKLQPEEDVFILKLGLPRRENKELITKNNKFYEQKSYDMYVEILKDGDENKKQIYNLSEKNVLLEFCNPMDEFENNSKGPCNKVLEFIKKLKI